MVVALTVLVTEVVKVLPKLIVKELSAVVFEALIVTINPPSITTTSPAAGTLAPGAPPEVALQVLVALQRPDATEKRFAAFAKETTKNIPKQINLKLGAKDLSLEEFEKIKNKE